MNYNTEYERDLSYEKANVIYDDDQFLVYEEQHQGIIFHDFLIFKKPSKKMLLVREIADGLAEVLKEDGYLAMFSKTKSNSNFPDRVAEKMGYRYLTTEEGYRLFVRDL